MKKLLIKKYRVSIIVPVYNGEQYIKSCIYSILSQEYENIQLIVVDDGSVDSTHKIAQELAIKDNRISLIKCQNSGVSSARNYGLKMATGDYVCFVDADDMISPKYIEHLINLADTYQSDMVMCTEHSIEEGIFDDVDSSSLNIERWSNEKTTAELLYSRITVGCWNKIFKRDFLIKSSINFKTDLFFGEGLKFVTDVSQRANSITVTKKRLYYYRVNESSVTSIPSVHKAVAGLRSLEKIKEELTINSPRVDKALKFHFWLDHFLVCRYYCESGCRSDDISVFVESKKYIRMHLFEVITSNCQLYIKFAAPFIAISPRLGITVFLKFRRHRKIMYLINKVLG